MMRLRASQRIQRYARAGAEAVVETLWPTRCIICERAGFSVCPSCREGLRYIDQWQACPSCGAPYGALQCTECNVLRLADSGRDRLPFDGCVSAVVFDDDSARIVRGCKDAGEQGLSDFMGYCIACAVPPEWVSRDVCIASVPATRKAKSARGFDHGRALANAVSEYLGLPCETLLFAGRAKDQRDLDRQQRFRNACNRFSPCGPCKGKDVLLVDDVYTTGATLCAATDALMEAGALRVRCATFARVY